MTRTAACLALLAGALATPWGLPAGVATAHDGAGSPPAARAAPVLPESPLGPELGNLTYRAQVKFGPAGEDADEYAGPLAAGERLSVTIESPFQSGLIPKLEFVGPDGAARAVTARARMLGKILEVDDWVVPVTGRWTVRVSGELGTYGRYRVRFRIRPPVPFRVEVEPDEDGLVPADVALAFDALEGSRLVLQATVRNRPAPTLVSLRDPAGTDVPGAEGPAAKDAVTRGRTLRLDVGSLGPGDGTYVARVTAPAGHGGLVATASVVAPSRERGNRRLDPDEPFLDTRVTPLRGVRELPVRITGRNFSFAPRPTVLFGDVPGTDVVVDPYGISLEVTPPVLPEGATVRIAVVNPDGQSSERPAYFYYVPAPVVTDLVDPAGVPVRGASSSGGGKVRLIGANFQTGIFIRFGQSQDVLPQILDDGRAQVVVPAHPAGLVEVRVLDAYAHDVVAPFAFEYKDPPVLAPAPYTPSDPAGDGTAVVAIAGTAFQIDDVVLFDGVPAPTVYWSSFELRFVVPPTSAGSHAVSVRDRLGGVVAGPPLVVR